MGRIWVLCTAGVGLPRLGDTRAEETAETTGVGLFALDALRIRLDNPVILKVVTAMGNNGLNDPLIDCWNTLDIGGDEGMEVMTLAGDTPGGYLSPWLPGLSSCLCIVMIKYSCVDAIVRCLLPRRSFGAILCTGGYNGCHSCGR